MKLLPDLSKVLSSKPEPDWRQRVPRPSLRQVGYIALAIATCLLLIWAFRPAPVRVSASTVELGKGGAAV